MKRSLFLFGVLFFAVFCNIASAGKVSLPSTYILLLNSGKPEVTTPGTVTSAGQTWMDRNLGASRVAISSTDPEAYGDLYQWGRLSDGHEKRYSIATSSISTSDTPGHAQFIVSNDWRTPQNDNLWQGASGINNPCPTGFRLPTNAELNIEVLSWGSKDSAGAFASPLKLVLAGGRSDSIIRNEGLVGGYWSSTTHFYHGSNSRHMSFNNGHAGVSSINRGYGLSVRCIKDFTCDVSHVEPCATKPTCTEVGGYWWSNNTCNSEEEPAPGTVMSAGQVWMDRNLGASRVATSATDSASYGDLYQWGRLPDGHEKRYSITTPSISTSDIPGHNWFIIGDSSLRDWRTPQNDNLWQGTSDINNPCPAGFRLPTDTELNIERVSWASNDSAGAFSSPLKLVVAGVRSGRTGDIGIVGNEGYWAGSYWSSTVAGMRSRYLWFDRIGSNGAGISALHKRVDGLSVRCLRD